MQSEQEKQVCISIGRRLKSEFFVLFVQQMFTVSEAEIEFCVEERVWRQKAMDRWV